ncbi:DNA/pantothenate metabolism flavo protein [Dunaliella salina]|uniref:DNA/pantothenate metabolism flavo protein n=1 Tax=Dunaliella salina TaxID=3046 RepID=A0ABQ7GEM1_DUNSA|nr:DNA/pantothenate metabolism flavo protein [Dunaliella salina]|eukprot:KAF5833058.1 DNA/pantothenate metabolism flavo protein [Dunaliella salina]
MFKIWKNCTIWSDTFCVGTSLQTEHKIQSSTGPLQLALHKVPKLLGMLTNVWVPDSMVVSFKLETDPGMLVRKAAAALRTYRVHIVVANLLHTRKDQVLLVTQSKGLSPTAQTTNDSKLDTESGLTDGVSSGHAQRSSVDFTTQVWNQQELEEQSAALKQEGCSQAEVWVDTEEINRANYEPYIERQLVSQVVAKHKHFLAQHQH